MRHNLDSLSSGRMRSHHAMAASAGSREAPTWLRGSMNNSRLELLATNSYLRHKMLLKADWNCAPLVAVRVVNKRMIDAVCCNSHARVGHVGVS